MNAQTINQCTALSDQCSYQLEKLSCRFCSPFYQQYIERENQNALNKFKICEGFANDLFQACQHDQLEKSNGECVQVNTEWKNGKDFVENVFDMVYSDDDQCFNGASQLGFGIFSLGFSLLLLFN